MHKKLKIIAIYFLLIIAVVVIGLIGKRIYSEYSLSSYCRIIEQNYSKEISMIEHNCRNCPDPFESKNHEEEVKQREIFDMTSKEMKEQLSKPEIYLAMWSHDGHHGIKNLRTSPTHTGVTTIVHSICFNSDREHSVCWGRTDDGRLLIVYIGIVPNGKVFHHYQIYYLLNELKTKM
jgi:hypothetical protein